MSEEHKSPSPAHRQRLAEMHHEIQPTPSTQGETQTPFHIRGATSVRPRADLGRSLAGQALTVAGKRDFGMVMGTPMGTQQSPQVTRSELTGRIRELRDLGLDELEEEEEGGTEDGPAMPNLHPMPEPQLWGTDINVQSIANSFRSFLYNFKSSNSPAEAEPTYRRLLKDLLITGQSALNLDCGHLRSFPASRQLAKQLQQCPQEVVPILDHVAQTEAMELVQLLPLDEQEQLSNAASRIQVRAFGLEHVSRMRGLDPEHIETLLTIKGMVVRSSAVVPDLKQAYFRCSICRHGVDVVIERGRIAEPSSCPACQALASLELVHNRCHFADKQLVRLQETPDEVPEGETPHTITIFAFDELVDAVRPGDRVAVTGILRAVPRRPSSQRRSVQAVFKTYIDAIHYSFLRGSCGKIATPMKNGPMRSPSEQGDNGDDGAMEMELDRDPDEEPRDELFGFSRLAAQRFRAFAERPDVYEALVKAFAPSVFEMDDVKRGLLCLLFGGSNDDDNDDNNNNNNGDEQQKKKKKRHGIHQRRDINVLLCGDPGTSKSQLLGYVHSLSPRGIYTSGKGSSAVGLTASVARDPETREVVLESGALVLSDRGVCCIDEFDKMSQTTRAVLHEAMEQQTVSISKAGIVATLNARTAILASANPLESRYNPRLSVVDNIQLPPTLLSRFDLIYLVLDKQDAEADRRLATHLVSMYFDDSSISTSAAATAATEEMMVNGQKIDQIFLREYIAFARVAVPQPQLSLAAQERLVTQYLELRGGGRGNGNKTISATPRQLESLIRLAQALAKMRLSDTVRENDVLEAARLMRVATQTAATDPRTGTIDMDLISTGRAALDRLMMPVLQEEIRVILQNAGRQVTLFQLRQMLLKQLKTGGPNSHLTTVAMADVEEAVRELDGEGFLSFMPRSSIISLRPGSGTTAAAGGRGGAARGDGGMEVSME